METFLLYIGKAALAAAAFYLLYLVLFQHQKQFTFNRIYLPVSLALSFLIPLITFTSVSYIEATPVSYDGYAYLAESTSPVAEPAFQWQWYHYLIGIYIVGSVGFLLYLILGHVRAISIIKKSRLQELFNVTVNVTFRDVHPFSFFNKIVLSEKTLKNPDLGMIVQHEDIHVRGKHTLDILFAEILFLFQWFNPFAWLLKDAIKNNLEYLTDHELTQTNDAQQYQMAMVGLAHKQGVAPFLTALNGSQLKNRIIMMKKKTENKYALLKQMVVLPLLAVLVMGLSNREVKTEIVPAKVKMDIVVDGKNIPQDDPAFKNIDFLNEFKGEDIVNTLEIKTEKPDVKKYSNTNTSIKEFTVKGKITDLNGNPISGAAVLIDGTTVGTISDRDGNYEIKLEDDNKTLIFVMLGYAKQEIEVNDRKEIDVQLIGDNPDNLPEKQDEPAFEKVDQMPEFPGGDLALRKYIANSLMYPKIAMANGIQGKVYVTFVVNKKGKVVNEKISRGVDPSLDQEALRVVSNLPLWKPGKKDGEIVNVSYTVPINFMLNEDHMRRSSKLDLNGERMDSKSGVTISGKVTNEQGEPVTGAAVIIKGTTIGTITDLNGMFLLGLNDKNDVLIISKVGYKVSEAIPNKENPISVVLKIDNEPKEREIQIKPVDKGKMTGGSTGVLIRSTTNPTNEPLYVVDGKIVANIEYLNPENIESVSVLKDESATKIYGEKGKNGVVVVNTKVMTELKKPEPLLILNGEKTDKSIDDIDPVDIESVNVIKDASAVEKYGDKGKNGVIEIITKNQVKANPLLIVDGEKTDKNINDLKPEDIASMSVYKDDETIKKYGEEGKDGVIVIRTKDYKITTELELRKFIAQNIIYPKKAIDKGEQGVVQVFMEFGKDNKTLSVQSSSDSNKEFDNGNKVVSLHNYAQSDIVNLDDVVVVAYANPDKPVVDATEKDYPYLAEEMQRLVNMLPPVEIPEFKGKAVGISVKFVLQEKTNGIQIDMDDSKSSGNSKYDIMIPEGFSPNGDGIHDVFQVKDLGKKFPHFRMKIMNEKSETIWEYAHNGDPNSTPKWWDGRNKENEIVKGTYFYLIAFSDGSEKGRSGTVILAK
ncbi:MAG TPA: TonB family protein [Draconibacterium sp.]|nr:TonB family protein [Draconibacterium sp.]